MATSYGSWTNADGRTVSAMADGTRVYLVIQVAEGGGVSCNLANVGGTAVQQQQQAQNVLNIIRSAMQSMFPGVS